jgi:selenocysteine lyase/cysteine desulfurase
MLLSQRPLFDIPREVCFLNAASWSPLPLASQEAGRIGVARKGQPWKLDPGFAAEQHARARRAAARLINAEPDDVALISSVSYGVATAAKLFAPAAGSRVLVLEDDHSSPVLEWTARAQAQNFQVETVRRPADGGWTAAVLAAIARPSAPVSLASISSVHWSDGGRIELDIVAAALRRCGAALLVDATHSVGVMKIDVKALDPDFLVYPTYKWVLGPYGRAFLYVARRHQDGVPVEQTSYGRRAIAAERAPYLNDTTYVTGARRFDMGERDHFVSLEMVAVGMELVAQWGTDALTGRLQALTRRIAEGVSGTRVLIPDERVRAPHILSLAFPGGMPDSLIERLAEQQIYVAPRLGRMRISPHAYNDEADVDRFVEAFCKIIA